MKIPMTRKREIIEITGGSYRALINVSEGMDSDTRTNLRLFIYVC